MITARHKPTLQLRPRQHGAVLSVRTVKPSFEEEPTRLFERPPASIPPPPL
jgi:hypothetical protein